MAVYYPECRINISAILEGFGGPDNPVEIADIVPHSVNVSLNSYKEADTWEVVFDAKRFPFSPELLKSAAVEIYLYLKPDQTSTVLWNDPKNLIVTGLVDNAVLTEDGDGGKVSLTGRDYTALMIDRQWDPLKSGKSGRVEDGDLREVVQNIVNEATQFERIGRTLNVVVLGVEEDVTISGVDKNVTKKKVVTKNKSKTTKVSKSKARKKRGITVKADSTYWDVIYKLCLSYGFIVYVDGYEVVITKPNTLQDASLSDYRMAYGRNLESLEVERKLSKESTPTIIVKSWEPKLKKSIQGQFPKQGAKTTGPTAINTKKDEFKIFAVPDVKDISTLEEIAKTTYYTLARGEGIIRFSTPHLRDLDNVDLTRMRAGSSVHIVWDAFNAETMLDKNISPQKKIALLRSLGYSQDVATLVAEQYSKLDYFRQPFYVKEVGITWDSRQGCKIDVEAMNFINPTARPDEI
jgi:hypothetical protein